MFLNCSILNIETLVEVVKYFKSSRDNVDYDENLIEKAISAFDSFIRSREQMDFFKGHGIKYVLIVFSFSKISFTIIAFLQLFFLDYFIGNGSQLFGVEVLSRMWHGEFLSELMIFPLQTICNFSFLNQTDHQLSVC